MGLKEMDILKEDRLEWVERQYIQRFISSPLFRPVGQSHDPLNPFLMPWGNRTPTLLILDPCTHSCPQTSDPIPQENVLLLSFSSPVMLSFIQITYLC